VFGMPGEAVALGAAHEVVHLDRIADRLTMHLGSLGEHTIRV